MESVPTARSSTHPQSARRTRDHRYAQYLRSPEDGRARVPLHGSRAIASQTTLWPIVLAGGAGTRFWPASRQAVPKPFVKLLGEQTLLDETLLRMARLKTTAPTSVIAARELAGVMRKALRPHKGVTLQFEPIARNTAPAIAFAAACALGQGCDGVIGIFPADHHIPRPDQFARTVDTAVRAAARGEKLVLIGVQPTRPDTAYGYLRIGKGGRGAQLVKNFQEKPKSRVAKRYFNSGEYLWNAGMLVARPELILSETREHAPEVWKGLGPALERIAKGQRVTRVELLGAFRAAEAISFDYAVLERSARTFAVRARFAWSDLGSWDALEGHLPQIDGNSVAGETPLSLGASGNIVWNEGGKTLVLQGVHDLVIVDTADALLICRKDQAQGVREVVKELSLRGRKDLA
ncbi:MAG: NTP transferase domain-containing protein [bacterium]|nr:NTP transferase domain-containing protein [bacterium]